MFVYVYFTKSLIIRFDQRYLRLLCDLISEGYLGVTCACIYGGQDISFSSGFHHFMLNINNFSVFSSSKFYHFNCDSCLATFQDVLCC